MNLYTSRIGSSQITNLKLVASNWPSEGLMRILIKRPSCEPYEAIRTRAIRRKDKKKILLRFICLKNLSEGLCVIASMERVYGIDFTTQTLMTQSLWRYLCNSPAKSLLLKTSVLLAS